MPTRLQKITDLLYQNCNLTGVCREKYPNFIGCYFEVGASLNLDSGSNFNHQIVDDFYRS